MGRKKKPRITEDESNDQNPITHNNTHNILIQTPDKDQQPITTNNILLGGDDDEEDELPTKTPIKTEEPKAASNYSITSGTGEIIPDDIYVSESEEENEEKDIEIILTNSIMGLMRSGRGGVLGVNNYMKSTTWVRKPTTEENGEDEEEQEEEEKEEESNPAKKLEQLKTNARRLESGENAGRDPCLFSKRTAFDIRMDQIEDKPWERGGTSDVTDYFNYGLTEEDWLEYAEQQLQVRQELTDAARQKRLPDPTIVPVLPKTPSKQTPKVAVASVEDMEGEKGGDALVGPFVPSVGKASDGEELEEVKNETSLLNIAGAWGAGVGTDSVL